MSLSIPRRFIADLLWASRSVESVTFERRMQLAPLATARLESVDRPGRCAIFTKAYALVCSRRPELRTAYLSFPWARLHESSGNVASVAVERNLNGERAVLIAHLPNPERRSLGEIESWIHHCRNDPIEKISSFRRILRVTRLPRPLRRLVWFVGLNRGKKRGRRFGTFGVSSTAGLGAAALGIPSPLTSILHYGVFEPSGAIVVRLTIDQRVLDGGNAARALRDLEDVLHNKVLAELQKNRAGGAPFIETARSPSALLGTPAATPGSAPRQSGT